MNKVGTWIVCVEIFEHCVSGFSPTRAASWISNKVCGNGGTMDAYVRSVSWRVRSCYEQVWGRGGIGTDSKRNSKVVYFNPYRPSLMDNWIKSIDNSLLYLGGRVSGLLLLFSCWTKLREKAEHFSGNNGPVLLFNTYMFRHWNCFLSSVAKDEKHWDIDWNRSRLKKSGQLFQVLMLKAYKNHQKIIIMVIAPWWFVWYFLHNSNRSILECVGENAIRAKLTENSPRHVAPLTRSPLV